jgi:hypothetical protein
MTDDSAGTDQRAERRKYVNPFVRNLDVDDTEGKPNFFEEVFASTVGTAGPS